MDKKCYLLILIILILLGTIFWILTAKFIPPINQHKEYVISGSILPSDSNIGSKPQYVWVYYPYYTLPYLCRSSDDIRLSAINWINESYGQYQIIFTVPIGLKEVILTTNCKSCQHKIIKLAETPMSVDLFWGDGKCEENFTIINDVGAIRTSLDILERDLAEKFLNSSDMDSIKKDIRMSRDEISESNTEVNSSDSLLHIYYAEWFVWKARLKMESFELRNCVEETNSLLQLYEDEGCFVPDYNAYIDYISANNTYASLRNGDLLRYSPLDREQTIDTMKNEITNIHGNEYWISKSLMKCENSYKIINGTFEYQKPYCSKRKISIYPYIFIELIVVFGIGIVIGQRWRI